MVLEQDKVYLEYLTQAQKTDFGELPSTGAMFIGGKVSQFTSHIAIEIVSHLLKVLMLWAALL